MAISLSNHEDRIKKLESISLGQKNCVKLYDYNASGNGLPATLSQSINSFDMIVIGCIEWSVEGYYCLTSCTFAVSDAISHGKIAMASPVDGSNNSGVALEVSENRINLIISNNWSNLQYVYGLKLYYSFSYNIIYKILLRKISRLGSVLHFNLFEISSRRGGVNYGN